jgi:general secretion pathway protein D
VEVSSDFLDQLGVRYSPNGAEEFTGDDLDNSIMANGSANYQHGFGGTTPVNTPTSSSAGTIAQALTSLRSGVLSGSISMDFLVQFLHRTVNATVLADPQLNIRNNETGTLFVGQEVPVPDNSLTSAQLGGQSTTFTYKNVGVTLEVIPHINSSGDVELKVHAESSTIVAGQTVLNGDVFNTANFHTDLTAKNGQTLVLGGIIQKQLSDTSRKTPFLGSIPGLGWAFKNRDKSSQEVELMVFLRPHVIHSPEDAKDILREVDKEAPMVKKWQDDAQQNKSQSESNK